jgi:hypothetical protein
MPPSTSQDDWEQHYGIPLHSKHFAKFCMLLFLLYDLVHVPGVRGLPQLDKLYLFLGLPLVWAGSLVPPFRIVS